jgi:hypothetical protein
MMKRTVTLILLSLVCGIDAVREHMAALPSQWNVKKLLY